MRLELLTLREVGQQIGLTETTAKRLRRKGLLQPDFEGAGSFLFDPSRVESLRAVVTSARNRNSEPVAIL